MTLKSFKNYIFEGIQMLVKKMTKIFIMKYLKKNFLENLFKLIDNFLDNLHFY